MLVIIILISTVILPKTAATFDLPKLELPAAPDSQPDDHIKVTTTVGAMRNALYYYELHPVLLDHIARVETVAYEQAEQADKVQGLLEVEKEKHKKCRRWFAGTGAALLAANIFLLVR